MYLSQLNCLPFIYVFLYVCAFVLPAGLYSTATFGQ